MDTEPPSAASLEQSSSDAAMNDATAAETPLNISFSNPQPTPSRMRNRPRADAFFGPTPEKATDPRLRAREAPVQSAVGSKVKEEPTSENEMELDSYPIQPQSDTPIRKEPKKLTINQYALIAAGARRRVEESVARKAMESGALFSQGNAASLGSSFRGAGVHESLGMFNAPSQGAGFPAGNDPGVPQEFAIPHFNEERLRMLARGPSSSPPPDTPAQPSTPRTGTKTNATPLLFNRLEEGGRRRVVERRGDEHRFTDESPLRKLFTGAPNDDPQTPTRHGGSHAKYTSISGRSSYRSSDGHGRDRAGSIHSDRHLHRSSGRSSRHRHRDHGRERRRSRSRSHNPFESTGGSSKSQRSGHWGSNMANRKPSPAFDRELNSLIQTFGTPSKSNSPTIVTRNQGPIDWMSQGFDAMALNTPVLRHPQFQAGLQSPYQFGGQLANLGYAAPQLNRFAGYLFHGPSLPGPQVPELFDIASDKKRFVNISPALIGSENKDDMELHAMNARFVWQGEKQLQLLAMELVIKNIGHLSHEYLLLVCIPHLLFDHATHNF
jgi:hypothetical protein